MDNNTEINFKQWSEFMERVYQDDSLIKTVETPLMLLIFVLSVVGNSVTCIVIYFDRTMHTLTNYYLFNLAMSDLLVTFAIPFVLHEQYYVDYISFHLSLGDVACKVHFFFIMFLWNNDILTMTALSVERYIAICYPMALQSTSVCRRVLKVILILWIVAIVEAVSDTLDARLYRVRSMSMCLITHSALGRIVNGVLAVITFLVPLGIMSFMYAMIAVKMKAMQQNTSEGRIFNKRNNSKVNKLTITLTAGFMVCWVPFFALRLFLFAWDTEQLLQENEKWFIYFWKTCALNTWFSTVLHPLVFSILSTKFQQSIKALWNRQSRTERPSRTQNILSV